MYCDGGESYLVTLHAFFDDRGKISAACKEDHSSKRGNSTSFYGIIMGQLEQVKDLVMDEVENLPPINEKAALMRTEREIYALIYIYIYI